MDTHPSLPQDLWEQTPPEVRAYIVTLEARVTAFVLVEGVEPTNNTAEVRSVRVCNGARAALAPRARTARVLSRA